MIGHPPRPMCRLTSYDRQVIAASIEAVARSQALLRLTDGRVGAIMPLQILRMNAVLDIVLNINNIMSPMHDVGGADVAA